MAGLKGLRKGDRDEEKQIDIEDFINGAKKRVDEHKNLKKKRTYERYVFSLTYEISEKIDQLSLMPKTFKASRSDVVKAALELLSQQDEFTINTALAKIVKS